MHDAESPRSPAARAIMTTDRYPKVRSVTLPGGGRIVGFAKGARAPDPHRPGETPVAPLSSDRVLAQARA